MMKNLKDAWKFGEIYDQVVLIGSFSMSPVFQSFLENELSSNASCHS